MREAVHFRGQDINILTNQFDKFTYICSFSNAFAVNKIMSWFQFTRTLFAAKNLFLLLPSAVIIIPPLYFTEMIVVQLERLPFIGAPLVTIMD